MDCPRIAIFGATSHIARNLIGRFSADGFPLHLYVRPESLRFELPANAEWKGYGEFGREHYGVIVNCVGAGTPDKLRPGDWFSVPEKFDNLVLDHLRSVDPEALCVAFGSGAIYGPHPDPVGADSCFSTPVNRVPPADRYSIMRLYTEAKHRSLADRNIVDIRIFSFFSRYASPDSGYFMTDVLKALLTGTPLRTDDSDMIRDYVAPDDLYRLIRLCMEKKRINAAFDSYSLAPVSKKQVLARFRERFGLAVERAEAVSASPNGTRSVYASANRAAEHVLGYRPRYSALQALEEETAFALEEEGISR